jgi:K(+)-stimulated pyrophosphate-energized sodium pump
VSELGLILAVNVAGLSFAVLLLRQLSTGDSGSSDFRRVAGALERASLAFLWQECRLVAFGTGVMALVLIAAHGAFRGASGALEPAFWTVLGLVLGAACACLTAQLAARVAARAAVKTLAAARTSLDHALSVAIRAAGAAGMIAETVSALGICSLFGLIYSMKGGVARAPEQDGAVALSVAMLLPGFAFGAVAAALVLQRGGSTYHVASDVGADLAGERDAGLEHDDARNPAVVSDLVGDQVGLAATRSTDAFVSASVANVAAVIIGASIFLANGGRFSGALSVSLLPIVVRAFGVIASGFGLMVVRTDDALNPSAALWRGHATTAIVSLGGLFGATYWLLGESLVFEFVLAGALGISISAAVAHAARLRSDRRFSALKDVTEALRVGDAVTVAQGLASGLRATVLPTLGIGIAMVAAWELGARTGLVGGGTLALTLALTSMLALMPYLAALANFGPIADSARGVLGMHPASAPPDAERRASRLDDAGFVAAAVAQSYFILVSCLSALLAAAALAPLSGRTGVGAGIDLAKPAVAWCGALGAAVVLGYAGSALGSAARGARAVALEVERQLRGLPRDRGVIKFPEGYTPSYRTCIEASTRAGLDRLLLPAAATLLLPAVLGAGLRLLYHSGDPGLPSEGLASFVVVASVTGLTAALAVDAARATLCAARRANRPRVASAGFAASLGGDAVADLVGNSAGAAAHLLVKATAVSALTVAPFLN